MIALPAAPALTLRELRLLASEAITQAGVENPGREADWLLADALRLTAAQLLTDTDRKLEPAQALKAWSFIERRAAREPLQYILGTQEFQGLEIAVTPDVLIPRPETELVVEEATEILLALPRPVIADVGTGSGCIAIALAKASPLATIYASDISWPALAVARRNVEIHDVAGQVKFVHADLLNPFAAVPKGIFDAVVSNPPYIADADIASLQLEVSGYEPRLALSAGLDGLTFYRRLLSAAPVLLKAGGYLIMELGYGQAATVRKLAEKTGLIAMRCRQDHAGIDRVLILRRPT
jgi:release factor glutamine methyltransferase